MNQSRNPATSRTGGAARPNALRAMRPTALRAMRPTALRALAMLGGVGAAVVAGAMLSPGEAAARSTGGAFRLLDVNVEGRDGVHQNSVLQFIFSQPVDPLSVNPAVFQIRRQNATNTGFTIQVPGAFQAVGSIVRFYPRLPGHLRDPGSATGDFFAFGTQDDDADANAGLQPAENYQIRVLGGVGTDSARSTRGRKLNRPYSTRFSTTQEEPKSDAFTIDSYGDAPPPEFNFSNPSDKVAAAVDQYARHGGTREVPNDIDITLFGNRVPLSPSTVRAPNAVTMQLEERFGNPALAKPIPGTPFVEQNFDGTRLVFSPNFPLPDRGTYTLTVAKDVRDLTEIYDFRSNQQRLALREIFEYLDTLANLNPGVPASQLTDPPAELIADWPFDAAARGVLKTNLLALGRAYNYEVDPRVMVLFTTRDEPVSNGSLVLEFVKVDKLFDDTLSTGEYDQTVVGAASGIFTAAGGSAANGDFTPTVNTTITSDSFPSNTMNFRTVSIPPNVTVTITGSRPAILKAINFTLDGIIDVNGKNGAVGFNSSSVPSSTSTPRGGAGGPGGGAGGNGHHTFPSTSGQQGNPGNRGSDTDGANPSSFGGFGGLGGFQCTGTYAYAYGGGGGGGGQRLAGRDGTGGTYPSYTSWSGAGGRGGAASTNSALTPLVGGAGGGSGGAGSQTWGQAQGYGYTMGAGGGGGGGALMIQTAKRINIGTSGRIRANGGQGGGAFSHSSGAAGPGGGGSGGSILLRSTSGFNISNPSAAFEVNGGNGGGATSYSGTGGAGGAGFIRVEDLTGAYSVPNGTSGTFNPVGGGVPSIVYTKWTSVGADQARFLNFTEADFVANATVNDAIFVEIQAAIEDPNKFGFPLLTALDGSGNSTNIAQVSQWTPVRVEDLTGNPAGAFGAIPGYNKAVNGSKYIFPIDAALNNRNYKFVRVRIRFQLNDTQTVNDPVPFLDKLVVNFQFNI